MIGVGLSIPERAVMRRGGAGQVITATTAPSLGALSDGDTLSTAVTWGSYATAAGSLVTPTTKEMSVNGGGFVAYAGATVVSAGDSYVLRETGANTNGDSRSFFTSTVTVAGVVPTLTASDSLSGRTLTITVDSVTGTPTPATTLTTLTLDGTDVLADATGTGPWDYVVPDSAAAQTVVWAVEATNFEGADTASGSEAVSANLSAPAALTAPSFSGSVAAEATVTIIEGIYSGTPAPTVTGTLTLNGVDVTGDMSGLDYTIPAGTDGQVLEWSETASNGITPDAAQSVSATVAAASTFDPATFFDMAWEISPSTVAANTDGTGSVSVGDSVRWIEDITGNGNHMTSPSASASPKLGLEGGVYYLDYDGNDDEVSVNVAPHDLANGAFFVSANEVNAGGGVANFQFDDPANSNASRIAYLPYHSSNQRIADALRNSGQGRVTQGPISPPGKVVHSANTIGTEATFRENGVTTITIDPTDAAANPVSRVRVNTPGASDPSRWYGGGVLERDATSQEVDDATAWMAGLTGVSLP